MLSALSLRYICVKYGEQQAVDHVSLDVCAGEIVALLGPNGSGKSTTLKVAAGLIEPSSGAAFATGISHSANPKEYAFQIGFVPQEPALYEELTAIENLHFFGELYGIHGQLLKLRVDEELHNARLADRAKSKVSTFSGGMKQRLNLAIALLHKPAVLLLDEPTAALDPGSRDTLFVELQRLRESGRAILLSTHHLDEVETGCDRVVVLKAGKSVAYGKPSDFSKPLGIDRSIIYAHLQDRLPRGTVIELQERLGEKASIEITGRRVRISAENTEELGFALSEVLSAGVPLDSIHTPPSRLDALLRERDTTSIVPGNNNKPDKPLFKN